MTRTLMRTAGAVAVLGIALLALSARRVGLSVRAQFLRVVLLPRLFRESDRDPATLDIRIAQDRASGPAHPSPAFRSKFHIREEAREGHPVFTVTPREGATNSLRMLYLHGGAYVYNLAAEHWLLIEGLIERTGVTVVVPLYPLAPEHDWQVTHALVRSLYEQLVTEVGAEHIVIAGDSAGGGLTLAIVQQLRDAGRPLPASLVLLSPWLDVTLSDPAQVELQKKDRLLSIPSLRRAGQMWAGPLPPTDPRISPLFGELSGLPPIAVFTGTEDLLNSDAHRLASKAKASGASLTLYAYPHEFHMWMAGLPKFIPEAHRALDQAGEFVRDHLER